MVLAAVGKLLRVELAEILFKDRSVACLRKGLNFTRFVSIQRDGSDHNGIYGGDAPTTANVERVCALIILVFKHCVHVNDFSSWHIKWTVLLRAVDL